MPTDAEAPNLVKRFIGGIPKPSPGTINRQAAANLMMVSFILLTTIGCFLIYTPAGFISAGLTCGLFGFLLGQE